ncbi:hypothetical protein GC177_03625 [bacterium]|nr:hypothetical protein [bacterium]
MSTKRPTPPPDDMPIAERIGRLRAGPGREMLPEQAYTKLATGWNTLSNMEQFCAKASDAELKRSAGEIMTKMRADPGQEGLQIAWLAISREWIFRKTADRPRPIYANAEQMLTALWHIQSKEGVLAEVKTGEGKTLIFALLAGLKAAGGHKVDVMTTSHYLSEEGAQFFNSMFNDLGLRASIPPGDDEHDQNRRRAGYAGDVIYAPIDRGVFDSLLEQYYGQPSRGFRPYDSLLLDEADYALMDSLSSYRISTSSARESDIAWVYYSLNHFIERFPASAEANEAWAQKARQWLLNESPEQRETIAGWDDSLLMEWLNSAHRAGQLEEDRDYVVQPSPAFSKPGRPAYQAVVVDKDKSGELKQSSRWSQGVHQFLHARLGFPVEEEGTAAPSMTLAQFVRQYADFNSMTGTAGNRVELEEMHARFHLAPVFIPPHNISKRQDLPTLITQGGETGFFSTLTDQLVEMARQGRPSLVALESIDDVNRFTAHLAQQGMDHVKRLDGLTPEQESSVIAEAGKPGAITLTTILGGRGIDIKPTREVLDAGGLHVIPALLPASGRVQWQLRGRAGRQGAPGSSQMIVNGDRLGLSSTPTPDIADQLIEGYQNHRIESDSLQRFKQDFEADVMQRYQQEFLTFVQAFQSLVYERLKNNIDILNKNVEFKGLARDALSGAPGFLASLAFNRERLIVDIFEKVGLPLLQASLGVFQRVRGNAEEKSKQIERGYKIFYAFANAATAEWDQFDDKARRVMDHHFQETIAQHKQGNYREVLNHLKGNIGHEVEPLWLERRERMLAGMNDIAVKVGLQPLPLEEVLSVHLEKPLSLDELKQHDNQLVRAAEHAFGEGLDNFIQRISGQANGQQHSTGK